MLTSVTVACRHLAAILLWEETAIGNQQAPEAPAHGMMIEIPAPEVGQNCCCCITCAGFFAEVDSAEGALADLLADEAATDPLRLGCHIDQQQHTRGPRRHV